MSNNKKVNQNERRIQISEKDELERMLEESSESLAHLTEEAKKLSTKHKILSFDYTKISKSSNDEASDIVGSNAMFYLNEDIIEHEDYVQQKMRADVVTMSDMLRQSKIAEFSIIKMIEQIDEGCMHPRHFEVLAGFQRSKLELTKSIANYVVVMENNYKAIKEDWKVKREENTEEIKGQIIGNTDDGSTQRGTRSLIETIRGELDRKDREKNTAKLKAAEANQKNIMK